MRTLTIAAFLIAAAAAAPSIAEPRFPHVADTSFVEADGDRVMQLSVVVAASPDQVWRAWTTAEGWKSFAVRNATVDFRVGGIIETNYASEFVPGAPENIRNEVVAYVPERMLTIRTVQTPRGFPNAEAFKRTATILEFAPAEGGTRVQLTAVGFEPGAAFDDLYTKFSFGNAYTLEKLRERFSSP